MLKCQLCQYITNILFYKKYNFIKNRNASKHYKDILLNKPHATLFIQREHIIMTQHPIRNYSEWFNIKDLQLLS